MGMNLNHYGKDQFPGLHEAVERALAKERAEKGLTGDEVEVTFVAKIRIITKVKVIKERDVNAFIAIVYSIQKKFPNIPIDITTETEPLCV